MVILRDRRKETLPQCKGDIKNKGPCCSYFLPFPWFGVTPCFFNSLSAWVRIFACSPIASRRMRSWQGSQIPPFSTMSFPQTMHFFFSGSISIMLPKRDFFSNLPGP